MLLSVITLSNAQEVKEENQPKPKVKKEKSEFWKKVRFGGGINVGFGNATIIGVSPEAIYQVNEKFSVGAGVGYQYYKYQDYSRNIFTLSGLALYGPIYEVQLSAKFEQNVVLGNQSRKVASLYLGAGYNPSPNVTIGLQYDVLYDKDKSLYSSPFAPFVRVYF